jgi:hypothetical protein
MWSPRFDLANLQGDPAFRERSLSVDAAGTVELVERTQGTFAAPLDEQTFPFDRQELPIDVIIRGDDLDHVSLEFHGDDVEFSRAAVGVAMRGWDVGVVDLQSAPTRGLRGKSQAGVVGALTVHRQWLSVIPPVFIPLFSSMLIPLIAIWLQKVNDEGEFEVDAFELANILIGGLFAVIALNFTVNAEYATLASGDNTVNRLFGLNYASLAFAMMVVIGMFQYGIVGRLFGKYVQEQLYFALSWAMPVLSIGSAIAFLLVAMA